MKYTLIATAFALMLNACTTKEAPKGKNIVVPIDISLSRDSVEKIQYKDVVQNSIITSAGQLDRIVVLPIDIASQTAGQEIFFRDFSKNVYVSEFGGMQAENLAADVHTDSVGAAQREFSEAFNSFLLTRKKYRDGTDIFGALQVAQSYRIKGQQNLLILVSDMVDCDEGQKDNLLDKLLSTKDVEEILNEVPKIDLADFDIVVVTGGESQMSPENYKLLRDFWIRYFKVCNANLVEYSSGSKSRLEALIANGDKH